jgi:hypothetical protein
MMNLRFSVSDTLYIIYKELEMLSIEFDNASDNVKDMWKSYPNVNDEMLKTLEKIDALISEAIIRLEVLKEYIESLKVMKQ